MTTLPGDSRWNGVGPIPKGWASRPIACDRASRILVYYIRTLWERSGMKWDSDNESEVRGVIEDILAAAPGSSQ